VAPKLAQLAEGRAPENQQFVIWNFCCGFCSDMQTSCAFLLKMQFVTFIPKDRPYKTP
jgi:hypothetical protein